MARINPALLKKLKKELNLSQPAIYKRIDKVAIEYTQPKNVAALILARDAKVSFLRFASPEELAAMQKIRNQVESQPHVGMPAVGGSPEQPFRKRKGNMPKASKKKEDTVFVVHGRDTKAREELSAFLRSLHVDVMEWNKAMAATGKASPYIGEVIDAAFERVQAIVVMMTPDDEAKLKKDFIGQHEEAFEKSLMGQPRQNVLLEAGMALAKSRETTILVQIGKIRPISDIAGVHITHLTGSMSSRQQLIGKLRTAGVKLDSTGDDWTTVGDFKSF